MSSRSTGMEEEEQKEYKRETEGRASSPPRSQAELIPRLGPSLAQWVCLVEGKSQTPLLP